MEKICVVGLGYVGLPLAIALSDSFEVIGIEVNTKKKDALLTGFDANNQVLRQVILQKLKTNFTISDSYEDAADCTIYIVTVPTPVLGNYKPDMSACVESYQEISKVLQIDNIVVLESTVYPGASEQLLLPILERGSKLKLNSEFFIGYSPERINPGDKKNNVKNINKLVSASHSRALTRLEKVYRSVVDTVVSTPTIKIAEASKVMENAQRDVNIAFMNEMEKIFTVLDIPFKDVHDAASTKWNFVDFYPGLVGGHCIGIDPYYLMDVARANGVEPSLLHAARIVNEASVEYHLFQILKMIKANENSTKPILGLGCSFKPNVNDLRNSKIIELYTLMSEFGLNLIIHDPLVSDANLDDLLFESKIPDPNDYSFIIMGVCHDLFLSDVYRNLFSRANYRIGR